MKINELHFVKAKYSCCLKIFIDTESGFNEKKLHKKLYNIYAYIMQVTVK